MTIFNRKPLVFALGMITAVAAQADHNSVWGEGWANMPNDIHDTRIDTMDDETDSFIDFVRMGSGAGNDNPSLSDGLETERGAAGGRGEGRGRS